ncbi:Hypothetical protein AKI40_0565 [Enterobacter sp. FY-07]|nr:Hypothetical protein AKI40_0565 [Enterobacter sp. FY-07]
MFLHYFAEIRTPVKNSDFMRVQPLMQNKNLPLIQQSEQNVIKGAFV